GDGSMAPDLWDVAGLGQMLNLAAGRVSDRKLDLFNGWCSHAVRPYLTDPRSRAAARYAELHIDEGCPDTPERLTVLLAATAAVEELSDWAHAAPTSPEMRRRRVYAFAAKIAQQALGHDLPNRGALANAQFTAFAFAWANDDRG